MWALTLKLRIQVGIILKDSLLCMCMRVFYFLMYPFIDRVNLFCKNLFFKISGGSFQVRDPPTLIIILVQSWPCPRHQSSLQTDVHKPCTYMHWSLVQNITKSPGSQKIEASWAWKEVFRTWPQLNSHLKQVHSSYKTGWQLASVYHLPILTLMPLFVAPTSTHPSIPVLNLQPSRNFL